MRRNTKHEAVSLPPPFLDHIPIYGVFDLRIYGANKWTIIAGLGSFRGPFLGSVQQQGAIRSYRQRGYTLTLTLYTGLHPVVWPTVRLVGKSLGSEANLVEPAE
jgi:hypothetical protein